MALGRPKKPRSDPDANTDTHGATTGYEAELWQMADAFEDRHALLESEREGVGSCAQTMPHLLGGRSRQ